MSGLLPRSFLYVPGNRPDLFAKAYAGPADALVLDLEDAVPLAAKAAARAAVGSWLRTLTRSDAHPQLWVRVDPDSLDADLGSVLTESLDGVLLAKCTAASLAETVSGLAAHATHAAGRPAVQLVGLVESARALTELTPMSTQAGLTTFGIGETDLLGDLRMTRSESTLGAVDQLRLQVVVACAAAGLAAPVAPTSTAFRDLAAFRETTLHLSRLGFGSRTAIHPGQLAVIHEVLTPDDHEVARAQDVLDRFQAAQGGVTTDVDGHLIDAAVVRGARETITRRDAADRHPR